MTANEKAIELVNIFNEPTIIPNQEGLLVVKNEGIHFAKITCNEILKAISPVDYEQRKYYKDVLVELDKM